jgi:chemotaxis protein MotB
MQDNESPGASWLQGLGGTLFWGVLSMLFASAACFYFWKSQENGRTARLMLDQQSLLQQQNASLKSDIEKLQSRVDSLQFHIKEESVPAPTPQPAAPSNPAAQPVLEALTKLATELSPNAEIKTRLEKEDVIVVLPNTLVFVPGSPTEIRSTGKTLLLKFSAAALAVAPDWNLRVESHTDNDGMKGYATTWDLTAARSLTVARLFSGEGKWPAKQLGATSCGDAHPLVPNDTKENKTLNRRIELRFSLNHNS